MANHASAVRSSSAVRGSEVKGISATWRALRHRTFPTVFRRNPNGSIGFWRVSRRVQFRGSPRLARSGNLGRIFVGWFWVEVDCFFLFALVLAVGFALITNWLFNDGRDGCI